MNGERLAAYPGSLIPAEPVTAEPVTAEEPVPPTLSLGPVTEIPVPTDQGAEQAEEIERAATDFGPVGHSVGPIGSSFTPMSDFTTTDLGPPITPESQAPTLPSRASTGAAHDGASNWLNLPGSTPGGENNLAEPLPGRPNGAAEYASAFDDLPRRGGAQVPQRPAQPPNLSFDPSDVFAIRPSQDAGGPHVTAPLPKNSPVSNQTELEGLDELPIRVRQANLAPQLREPTIPAQASRFVAAPEMHADPATSHAPAGEPSPEAARNTMAALQRGWERGRSVAEQMSDEPDGEQ
jgi:hypothetical protein